MFDLYYKGRDSHLLHRFWLFSTYRLQNIWLVTIKIFFKQRKEISIYINKLIINTWKSKTAQKFVSSSTVGFPSWLAWRIIPRFSFQQTADEKYPWDMNYNTKKRNYNIVHGNHNMVRTLFKSLNIEIDLTKWLLTVGTPIE